MRFEYGYFTANCVLFLVGGMNHDMSTFCLQTLKSSFKAGSAPVGKCSSKSLQLPTSIESSWKGKNSTEHLTNSAEGKFRLQYLRKLMVMSQPMYWLTSTPSSLRPSRSIPGPHGMSRSFDGASEAIFFRTKIRRGSLAPVLFPLRKMPGGIFDQMTEVISLKRNLPVGCTRQNSANQFLNATGALMWYQIARP